MGSMTHRNGMIYHSNCDSDSERKNLSIKISDDCFKTYSKIFVSDLGGYSDIAILGDKLFIFYEMQVLSADKERPSRRFELFFETFDLSE